MAWLCRGEAWLYMGESFWVKCNHSLGRGVARFLLCRKYSTSENKEKPVLRTPHHLDADPDPAFHFDADPDPTFHSDADPAFQIYADPNLQHCTTATVFRLAHLTICSHLSGCSCGPHLPHPV